jgi:tetratricopeptide (TPR) repeat protein
MIDYARVLAEAGELERALEQADLTIAIDPNLAVGHFIKGGLLHVYKGEVTASISLYEHALRITPQSPIIASQLSCALIDLGYFERAYALIDETAPFYPDSRFPEMRALMQILRGDHAGAAEIARVVLDYLPNVPWALSIVRDHHIKEHTEEKALELYRRAYPLLLEESHESVDLAGWAYPVAIDLSVLLIEMGRTELASKLLSAALDTAEHRWRLRIGPPTIELARIHALLGDTDAALHALQWAVDAGWRHRWQLHLYHDVALNSLHDLPEFQALVDGIESDIERQRRELEARLLKDREG